MVQLSPPSQSWLHCARMQDFSRAKSKMLVPEAQGQFNDCTRWAQHQSGSGEADEFTLWYTHRLHKASLQAFLESSIRSLHLLQLLDVVSF